ncbi:MAG: GNAT family protein [Eubacteriales bacterium]|nr:GNAT family protein [Eubacteriales bacterium]
MDTAKPDVYVRQPTYENELTLLRPVEAEDARALLQCYSDPHAVPFFNVDNCNGDDFYYTTVERMAEAIAFWNQSYRERVFVRWAVVDQAFGEAVGTVEMFHRIAEDEHNHVGLLRLDLQSRFETRAYIYTLLGLCLRHFYDDFSVERILTKAPPRAVERRAALTAAGFTPLEHGPLGLPDYFERKR